MINYLARFSFITVAACAISSCQSANSNDNLATSNTVSNSQSTESTNQNTGTVDVSSWSESSRMAVDEITKKYGEPTGIMNDELIWTNVGGWKKICISKMESKHNFPIEHTDMMQTTIMYSVPVDKMDDLGMFDGSVTFDRTQGTMSARCDMEANNYLALNLANDIITNKKTVAQARQAYGDIIKEKMSGKNPEYMTKLTFSSQNNAADPDKNTTGLTKAEVTAAVEKNSPSK